MSDKRFLLCQDDLGNYEIRYDDKVFHFLWEVAPILNEQQAEIEMLEKGILDCLFNNKSIGMLAEEMGLVE